MKNKILNYLHSVPRYVWILAAIVLVGIFFRTYNFREWLVFNPDQARDAMLIESALENKANFPLLGPEAGNTRFQLGPIFYWFEYASAKIFGSSPEALAYPDVFFSILTIIIFFFFAKKYFSENISLALTALISVSFFTVRYSRFAMNTNPIPFWTLLFLLGILNLLDEKNKKSFFWPMITGIALGIGIQLHALLLISMPILSFIVLFLLIKRKLFTWKNLAIIIFFLLAVNVGQIIFDIKNSGANSGLFVSSVVKKSGDNNLLRNLEMDIMYQFQANVHMLSSLGDKNDPRFMKIINRIAKDKSPYATFQSKILPTLEIFLSAVFSIAGYFFLGYFFRKEKDQKRRNFLFIVSTYSLIMFLVMLPIIQEASIRYFIVLLFLPFIFLGLWVQFFLSRKKEIGICISMVAVALLILLNVITIGNSAKEYAAKKVNNVDNSILGEDEIMLDYMINKSKPSSEIYLVGKRLYAIRFYKPLAYLAEKNGVNIIRTYSEKDIKTGIPLFYVKDSEEKNKKPGEVYKGHVVKDVQKFNNIMIYNFEN